MTSLRVPGGGLALLCRPSDGVEAGSGDGGPWVATALVGSGGSVGGGRGWLPPDVRPRGAGNALNSSVLGSRRLYAEWGFKEFRRSDD